MTKYPKIQGLFKRDEKTHKFIEGEYSLPEFEYLKGNDWTYTEKIDGTNVRVIWDCDIEEAPGDMSKVTFGARTDNGQLPTFLYSKLAELFPKDKFLKLYPDMPMTLYGEGYGARIQKGGGNYIPDGVSFILFDVKIDDWWLKREDVEDVASKLGIDVVPIRGDGAIQEAVDAVKVGVTSIFGDFEAEGLVLKPAVELRSRSGHRIVTKLKHKDFADLVREGE